MANQFFSYSSRGSIGGGGGGGGVTSLNSLTGALTLVAGSGISITPAGSNITIASTGGGGANTALSNLASVAINTSLLPGLTDSIALGGAGLRYTTAYLHTILNDNTAGGPASDLVLQTQRGISVLASYLDMGNSGINNLLDPIGAQDAATKAYVDANVVTISFNPVGSSPNGDGASVPGPGNITLQPADATNPGLLTAAAQALGGDKTLAGSLELDNVTTTNVVLTVKGAPSNAPTDLLFDATYTNGSSLDATYIQQGSPTPVTTVGSPVVTANALDLTANTGQYVQYDGAAMAAAVQTGTIRFRYTPNYTGNPPTNMRIFTTSSGALDGNSVNRISISTSSTTDFEVDMWDASGGGLFFITVPYAAVTGVTTEWEFNWDLTAGASRLFQDGVQVGATDTTMGTRDSSNNHILIGADNSLTTGSDFSITDIVVYNTVQHTANFSSPIPPILGPFTPPQTADLQDWIGSTGSILSFVDKSGFITLPGDPTTSLMAATKQYVDTQAANLTLNQVLTNGNNAGLHNITNLNAIQDASNINALDVTNRVLFDEAGNPAEDFNGRILYDSSEVESVYWQNRILYDSSTIVSVDWLNRNLMDASNFTSIDWTGRILHDGAGVPSENYTLRNLIAGDGTTVVLDWTTTAAFGAAISAPNFSGSSSGTNTGDVTAGGFGGTPNNNGAILTGQVLHLQPADATHPGGVSTLAQTFAGNKTFANLVLIPSASTQALTINTSSFVFDSTNNSLGINGSPGSNTFIDAINSSGGVKRIQLTGYGNTVGYRSRYANGTQSAPTAAVNTNVLNFISAQGFGVTGFPAASTALMNFTAAGTFTDSSMPTDINFSTTPTGSVTAVQVAQISHTGATTLGASASAAIHQINGGLNVTTRTITANLTIDTTTSDYIIFCNQSGAITLTLPAPTNGRMLVIKDSSGTAATNNITLAQHASEKIEGLAASKILQTNFGSWTFTSDGTDWWMI